MMRIIWCSIPFLFFAGATAYTVVMAFRDVPVIGYVSFLLYCIPLGFALIWGARLYKAIDRWRRRQ